MYTHLILKPYSKTIKKKLIKKNILHKKIKIKKKKFYKYKPIFVNDKCMFPNKLAFKENKSLTSNWSKGLKIKSKCNIFYCFFFFLYSIDGF